MAEYIEREPLIKYCTAMFNLAQRLVQSGYAESDIWKGIHQTQQEERKEFLEILKSASSADVTPVRHGHWINIPPYQCEAGYKKGQQCSECYAYYVSDGTAPWSNHRYCAECGAKMDGEVEWESEQP